MSTSSQPLPGAASERMRWHSLRLPFGLSWTVISLSAIVALAAALRFGNLAAIGQSNTYYTAAVESMLDSWRNFFYVAAEPGGSVSVDKPPVGLWLEAVSAYFLGVSGFATVLPNLLAGLGSVVLVFFLVRRWFGDAAGLLAALALAVTPVAIAVERNNTPDGMLIFTLLLATWAFVKATETGQLRYLVTGAALIGVGFNIKMLQAFLPLPALYALYFLGAEQGWWRKLWHLSVATLVLIPVALSWATVVDLTPADQRPYVGSSQTNSVYNLIFGYNGLQRLEGNAMGGGNRVRGDQLTPPVDGAQAQTPDGMGQPGAMPGGPGGSFGPMGGPGGGMFGTGTRGPLRLFQSGLAAQVSWLLPFGLISLVGMALGVSWRKPTTNLHRGLILWGGWLVTCVVFFSVAGFFHQYYLAMMGPPLAAIVGMGLSWLWRLRATHPARAALLLIAAATATLCFQVYAVAMYGTQGWWLALPLALGGLGIALLAASLKLQRRRLQRLSFAVVTGAVLIVPTVWSGLTTAYANTSSALTQAYSGTGVGGFAGRTQDGLRSRVEGALADGAQQGGQQPGGMPGDMGSRVDASLLSYLQAHTQDTRYLVVVASSGEGAGFVLATGRPVLYAGGFSGSDPVLDATSLAKLVTDGDVRYVLWGGGGGPRGGSSSITAYLQSSCSVVSDAGQSTAQGAFGGRGGSTLYQCDS